MNRPKYDDIVLWKKLQTEACHGRKITKNFQNMWHQMDLKGAHDRGLKTKIKKLVVQ